MYVFDVPKYKTTLMFQTTADPNHLQRLYGTPPLDGSSAHVEKNATIIVGNVASFDSRPPAGIVESRPNFVSGAPPGSTFVSPAENKVVIQQSGSLLNLNSGSISKPKIHLPLSTIFDPTRSGQSGIGGTGQSTSNQNVLKFPPTPGNLISSINSIGNFVVNGPFGSHGFNRVTITRETTIDTFTTITNLFYNSVPVTITEFIKVTVSSPTQEVSQSVDLRLILLTTSALNAGSGSLYYSVLKIQFFFI